MDGSTKFVCIVAYREQRIKGRNTIPVIHSAGGYVIAQLQEKIIRESTVKCGTK